MAVCGGFERASIRRGRSRKVEGEDEKRRTETAAGRSTGRTMRRARVQTESSRVKKGSCKEWHQKVEVKQERRLISGRPHAGGRDGIAAGAGKEDEGRRAKCDGQGREVRRRIRRRTRTRTTRQRQRVQMPDPARGRAGRGEGCGCCENGKKEKRKRRVGRRKRESPEFGVGVTSV